MTALQDFTRFFISTEDSQNLWRMIMNKLFLCLWLVVWLIEYWSLIDLCLVSHICVIKRLNFPYDTFMCYKFICFSCRPAETYIWKWCPAIYIDGLVQDFNISIANALEILQSCTTTEICGVCGISWISVHQWNVFLHKE